jgi:2-(1,2-epoxy-1,2-dihydrophenyl)acetyl-CoA isomerase
MPYEAIKYRKENGAGYITLNRPKVLNAWSDQLLDELIQLLDEIAQYPEVKVVVLTGEGRAFSVGADHKEAAVFKYAPPGVEDWMADRSRIPIKLRSLPKPVIASINGIATGGAVNLALACDIIIASEEARFSQIFVNIGVHPDTGGTYFLPRLVGVARAMELFLTGRFIDAKEAERIGMINKVVPAEKLEAESLARGPTLSYKMIKQSVYQGLTTDLETALRREGDCQAVCLTSEDCKEGLKAFLEKRKPEFKGK